MTKFIEPPTEFGIKKYPPNGLYEEYPCTCVESCPPKCKSVYNKERRCNCLACEFSYIDSIELY